jgi:hypothetical protein
MEKLLQLTKDNYYSLEADQQYFSVSQYKSFKKCESSTLAKIKGEYEQPKSEALLLGSYVHSWLDNTIEDFKKDNPEIFSSRGASKGQLKSQYQNANEMIRVLENDPFCMMALQGEKEVIFTGELFGVPWKIRMDVYNPKFNRFADLKTVKNIREKQWIEGIGWGSFVEAYGYVTQMAVYSEIESQNRGGDWLENYIVAVSKESIPDKEIIIIDQESLGEELNRMSDDMERLVEVKTGSLDPKRCEKCDYCKRTKMIKGVVHYLDLVEGA